jgi:cell division protein FtsB
MSEQVRRKLKAAMQENARLKAEVEELKSQPDPLTAYLYAAELAKDDIKKLKAEVTNCKAESDRLKGDVERLTIGNALTLERLEAMKRLNAIRRWYDKPETGPLTDAPD